jgi:hypothetical protein
LPPKEYVDSLFEQNCTLGTTISCDLYGKFRILWHLIGDDSGVSVVIIEFEDFGSRDRAEGMALAFF